MTYILLVLLVIAVASGVGAQGEQTTYTSDSGFTITYESNQLFSESEPDFLNLVTINGMVVVTYQFFAGDAVNTLVAAPNVPQTAADYFAAYLPTLAFLGVDVTPDDIEQLTLANGEASVLEFNQLGLNSILIAVDLSNGELVVLYAITTGTDAIALQGMRDEALTLAEGLYYGEGAPAIPGDATEAVTVRLNQPLFYSELPVNTVITPSGAIFNYSPEVPPIDGDEVTDQIVFSSGDEFILLVEIFSANPADQIAILKNIIAPDVAGPDYDPATDWQVLTTEQGLNAEAFTTISEETPDGTILLFVELDANHLAVLRAEATDAGRTPENEGLIVTIVDSIRLLTPEDVDNYRLDATISGGTGVPVAVSTPEVTGGGEFVVDGSTLTVDGQSYPIEDVTCVDASYVFISEADPVIAIRCPAGCNTGLVWGTDIYTNDSSMCLAAIHQGEISFSEGGVVLVTWAPGLSSYTGTTANGVTTLDYGSWGESFTLLGLTSDAPPSK